MTAARTNSRGLALIKSFEGLRLKAYQDSVGVWTVGYGHTATAYQGQTITEEYADQLLQSDIARAELGVSKLLGGIALNSDRFSALVSFAFNLGVGALQRSTLLRKIKEGKMDEVPAEIMRWNRAGGKVLAGLTRRRKAEALLWQSKDTDTGVKRGKA